MSTTNNERAVYLKVTITSAQERWAKDTSHTLDTQITLRKPDGLSEYYPAGSWDGPDDVLRTLAYRAVDWNKSLVRGESAFCYGSLHFTDQYLISRDKLEHMTMIFKQIDRGMARMDKDLGPAESPGQYLLRLGKVLGAAGMIFESTPFERECTGMKEHSFSLVDGANKLRSMIFHLVADAREGAANAEPVAVAATA